MLKVLKEIGTSYVTSLFASFSFLITHYYLSSSVEHSLTMMHFDSESSSSVEHSLTMMTFDSSSSVVQLCDKVLLTVMPFDCFSSMEQVYDKFSLTRNSFNYFLSVEQNVQGPNLFCSSHFRSYRSTMQIEGIVSYHTLRQLSC